MMAEISINLFIHTDNFYWYFLSAKDVCGAYGQVAEALDIYDPGIWCSITNSTSVWLNSQ
jgi:hypothetical protein